MEGTATPIAEQVGQIFYWTFLGVILLNVVQRRHQNTGGNKRMATLYIALGVFVVFLTSQAILIYGGRDWMLVPATILVVAVLYYYREKTFPFRWRSPLDGRRLTWDEILYHDDHGDSDRAEDAKEDVDDTDSNSDSDTRG